VEAPQLAGEVLLCGDDGVTAFADIPLMGIPLFGFTAPSHAYFGFDV